MGETPRRRRRIRTIQFLSLTALVMVLVTGTVALGEEHEQGLLLLRLGPDANEFEWTDDSTTYTQGIIVNGCEAHLDPLGDGLVTVTQDPARTLKGDPTTPVFGFFNHGAGAKTKGKGGNGQPCGRVDGPDEAIAIALANDTGDPAEGLAIARADLDIERKFDVAVAADLYLSTLSETVPFTTLVLDPAPDSDSGPDSNDHWRWVIEPTIPFDRIVLRADESTPDGAFSLDGGATGIASSEVEDWEGITESIFELVVPDFDGIVACGESTDPAGNGTTTALATFTREDDDPKNEDPCSALVLYSLDSTTGGDDSQTVTFQFGTQELPSWTGTIAWAPEVAALPVLQTWVDANTDGIIDEDDGDFALQWCLEFGDHDEDENTPDRWILPEGQGWCLLDQHSVLQLDGKMQVTQEVHGGTDPGFHR